LISRWFAINDRKDVPQGLKPSCVCGLRHG
jgi:hypothetical protein